MDLNITHGGHCGNPGFAPECTKNRKNHRGRSPRAVPIVLCRRGNRCPMSAFKDINKEIRKQAVIFIIQHVRPVCPLQFPVSDVQSWMDGDVGGRGGQPTSNRSPTDAATGGGD
ncbi:hypothetical protein AAFF_G00184810 [Aldrovandia affinis]|uniref:Uncharacterized protein n=1 Tax=Aldrovandia affinis TaxID=143900 RepID=A0AAD7W6E7_9TELE|nr:hypothetical protein AAFF_G00184810 [Aldrovandia affinis]